ncbi:unnamed protein product [Sphenostylis stenocarpa]|uniref:Uncharacterized protein n=1 Tax=Sphenostylis stenocarpa TaxID=92480 RepID=A0AA86VIF2_9FABA|nr:unnamed protein product [Sphenostylis stenocarpa]
MMTGAYVTMAAATAAERLQGTSEARCFVGYDITEWMKLLLIFFLFTFSTDGSSRHRYHHVAAVGFSSTPTAAVVRQIRMRGGAPLKMAMFADLHFGEAACTEWGPQQDVNSTKVINTVLHDEAPGINCFIDK